jgi:hypothetical protein
LRSLVIRLEMHYGVHSRLRCVGRTSAATSAARDASAACVTVVKRGNSILLCAHVQSAALAAERAALDRAPHWQQTRARHSGHRAESVALGAVQSAPLSALQSPALAADQSAPQWPQRRARGCDRCTERSVRKAESAALSALQSAALADVQSAAPAASTMNYYASAARVGRNASAARLPRVGRLFNL